MILTAKTDTCNIYSKDPQLRDGPVTPDRAPFGNANAGVINGPRIHEFWQEIRKDVLNDFGDPLMVGELGGSTFKDTLKFIGREPRELSMVFDFTYTALGKTRRLLPILILSLASGIE
jgi:oligo-1,6-glucosidase